MIAPVPMTMIFRPQLRPTLVMLPVLAILAGLGVWQLQRLEWKEGLIEAARARASAAPIPLEQALAQFPESPEYRRVTVRGRFDHSNEVYLFTKPEGRGPGYNVITPLIRDEGPPVLVERGFVPEEKRLPETRARGQVTGEVAITGLLRAPQEGTAFTPPPDREKRIWYARDIEAMAEAAGVTNAPPVTVAAGAEATPPGGWPRGGTTRLEFVNRHLEYALTWFALAAVLVVIYLVYHYVRGHLRWRP
ncbi:MAG: SURF1 family protein [Alphaproteobacteria bacterium]